jgi:mannose/fructose/N-acetylgalactosamine-specific phosphotransferase system component IID
LIFIESIADDVGCPGRTLTPVARRRLGRGEYGPRTADEEAAPLRGKRGELEVGTLLSCFLRCYLIGAAYNTRGLQHVGLTFAMEPGLAVLYPDPAERDKAFARYLKLYNTHFFWTPLMVGLFLSLEVKIAQGVAPAEMLDNIKTTTAFTLSAIGDTFFSASIMGLWGLSAACLVASGHYTLLACLAGALLVTVQIFKALTFHAGYREGFQVLRRLKRWDLVNLGRKVKVANAALLAVFWILARPLGGATTLADAILVGLLVAWAATKPLVSREIALLVLAAGWILARSMWPV